MAEENGIESGRDILQLVTFKLGEEEFAVDILGVREINRVVEITRVPKAPVFVEGVINLRGRVITIIDLRKRLSLPKVDYTKQTRIIVVDIEDNTVGMVVDSVCEVLRLPVETIESPPKLVSGIGSEYLKGVGRLDDRLIILLDLDKVLNSQEKSMLVAGLV